MKWENNGMLRVVFFFFFLIYLLLYLFIYLFLILLGPEQKIRPKKISKSEIPPKKFESQKFHFKKKFDSQKFEQKKIGENFPTMKIFKCSTSGNFSWFRSSGNFPQKKNPHRRKGNNLNQAREKKNLEKKSQK